MKSDAKPFVYIVLYGFGKRGNILAGGSSQIGEYQWLQRVDASPAKASAFPSALFDKPCSGDFHSFSSICGLSVEVWHVRIFGEQS